jgi:alpha-amylase/alpha-mannosidase (GH57 family)
MSAEGRVRLVLCWHMHQPWYRDLYSGEYQLPWTYLHAIKDYADMAWHLEAVPEARAVVNFAPTLIEQINDYAEQVHAALADGAPIHDPLLAALDKAVLPGGAPARQALIQACLRANHGRMIARYPNYQRLARMAGWLAEHPDAMLYIDEQYLADLLVWYHLAWLGESVRRENKTVQRMIEKGHAFTLHERRELLEVIGTLLAGVLDRYQALADRGQVELSVTPYAHPIIPLLLDIKSAREAQPGAPLPHLEHYPDGEARARWHIEQGLAVFRRQFGTTPAGCWPAEGSISGPTLRLLEECGFQWTASGETVLGHSLHDSPAHAEHSRAERLYQPWCLEGKGEQGRLACFFRDDGLSDLIGFSYSTWHADDAVANLIHHLDNIATASQGKDTVVSIIMDGENAWEHYPENGFYFLSALYQQLSKHPRIALSTYSECLKAGIKSSPLPRLVAGSWVYGTFSTWIGDPDKNRAWDMLGDAKRAFDQAVGRLDERARELAERQLAICEGSDWFWWFGDYNPADTVSDFERLYRLQLANLYQMLGVEPPEYLAHVFARGGGAPSLGGVMRRGQQ